MPWFRKWPTDEINNSEEKHWAIWIFDDSCILNYDYNFDANISNKVIIWVNWTFITLRKENYNFWLWDEETWNEFETREIINWKINIVEWWITCKSSKNGDNKESSNVLTIIKWYIEDEDDFLPIWDWSWEYYIKWWNWLRDETLWEEKKWKEIWKKEIWNLEYEDWSFVVKDAPWFDFESFSDEDMEQYNELIDENWW